MRTKLTAALAIFLAFGLPGMAHRLDEYLQASLISVERDHLQIDVRLVPGVAVSSAVLASIDTNGDGLISAGERQAYAQRVLRHLSLSIDGAGLSPRLVSVVFPETEEIKEGLGEIKIALRADLPPGGAHRRLIFQNQQHARMNAYLVNCLTPRDNDIRVSAQIRNEDQSFYQLDYSLAGSSLDAGLLDSALGRWLFWYRGFAGLFRLGMRHIAEGTDHLLFLLTLLLPAPLLVCGSRWSGYAGVRESLLKVLKVVSAFTVGHSVTLMLAAFGVVHVPSRPIEVLIAVSIFVSAVHALRPLFPGREAGIAAFFGLIHGLAFATTLGELGLSRWQRVSGILGFNLGIETMQAMVVVAAMPSLILLSRTRGYSLLRQGGALFAGIASLGWILERLWHVNTPVDLVVNALAQHAAWVAGGLFIIGFLSWCISKVADSKAAMKPLAGHSGVRSY